MKDTGEAEAPAVLYEGRKRPASVRAFVTHKVGTKTETKTGDSEDSLSVRANNAMYDRVTLGWSTGGILHSTDAVSFIPFRSLILGNFIDEYRPSLSHQSDGHELNMFKANCLPISKDPVIFEECRSISALCEHFTR